MLFIRLTWWLVRLPLILLRLPGRITRLLRRLLRERWFRRLLAWLFVRQVRRSGWVGTAKLLLRSTRRVLVASWHTTLGMLWLGRRIVRLIGWVNAHRPAVLAQRTRRSLRGRTVPGLLPGGGTRSSGQPSQDLTLKHRVARRRDVIRRSILASVGVDPNWRPARRRPVASRSGPASR